MIDVYGYSIATIPSVCAVVYGIIEFLKYFIFSESKVFGKYIPLVAAGVGGVVALLAFAFYPELVPVGNWFSAILIGAASGLSAVGVNQIKKQMGGGNNDT